MGSNMNFTYSGALGGMGGSSSQKMGGVGAHPLYRGYSPSKPKWKGAPGQAPQNQYTAQAFSQAYQPSSALMSGYMR